MWRNSYERRRKIFSALVESVALYEAEIWRWTEETTLDKIKRKY